MGYRYMTKWGYMLSLDIAKCKPQLIRSKPVIYKFTKSLVKEIDMKAYGEPQIVHFGEGNKAGYTLVQLIETSNITAHFCEEDNAAFIDIFSCKPYDIETAVKVVDKYFKPEKIVRHYIERSIPELS
jgi:S-adenosylmethionine/arginine decarboxylase-like enzyme